MATDAKTPTETESQAGTQTVEAPKKRHGRRISGGAASLHLDYPPETQPVKFLWPYLISITTLHVIGLTILIPPVFSYLFSWTGVVLFLFGLYVFGTLGINLCYHRLLTHTSAVVPKWLEHTFAILGVCCLEDTPARWVAIHRLHHKDSDEQEDPHSPLVNFFWGHCGWLMVENRGVNSLNTYDKYARDILRDRFYFRLEKNLAWFWIYLAHAAVFYLGGFAAGWWMTGTVMGGVQFGLSLVMWGVILRTIAVWHITWSVNSVTHVWGYQNYDTGENSKNNWIIGLISNGEGWHNNHHADQRSAAHGHRWWEFDVTYITIQLLQLVGLAKGVVRPKHLKNG